MKMKYTVMGTSVLTKPILCTKRPKFTMPFYYVKVPKSKNELTHVHVGQKHPFTQKIRSLAQKMAILVFLGLSKKVRNVSQIGQKSKNESTHLHVGQKHPSTQEIRSLAQKWSILT